MTNIKLTWTDLSHLALQAVHDIPENTCIAPASSDVLDHMAALLVFSTPLAKKKRLKIVDSTDVDTIPIAMQSQITKMGRMEAVVLLFHTPDVTSYSFPWESTINGDCLEDSIRNILIHIGEDPMREGLLETPKRVVASYQEIFKGYSQTPEDHLKVFEGENYDEMVLLKGCEFYSNCEHHMQPFFGVAHIAYIPNPTNPKVIGISKLGRVLDVFAKRLQIQERLTCQVTDALMKHLKPLGAACVIEAKHFCMVCRGVHKQQSTMITSSLQGVFKEDQKVRQEFMALIQK